MIPTESHETSCCHHGAIKPLEGGGGGDGTLQTNPQIPSPSTGSNIFLENAHLVADSETRTRKPSVINRVL